VRCHGCAQGNGDASPSGVIPGGDSLILTLSPTDSSAACGPVTRLLDDDLAAGDQVFVDSCK
jgi:hypothetical protein